MIFTKHNFEYDGNKIAVYYFEDRYRYTVTTDKGIEYRELGPDPTGLLFTMPTLNVLETFIIQDINVHPYGDQQFKFKCVRCSAHRGSPRKQYNLAPMCDRCFNATTNCDEDDKSLTWYGINEDGSKGSCIKEL